MADIHRGAPPIIRAGTRLFSLSDGRYLVTVVRDWEVGDYVRDELFDDWAIEKPNVGEPIGGELMDVFRAIGFAYMATTGLRLRRLDTGAYLEFPSCA